MSAMQRAMQREGREGIAWARRRGSCKGRVSVRYNRLQLVCSASPATSRNARRPRMYAVVQKCSRRASKRRDVVGFGATRGRAETPRGGCKGRGSTRKSGKSVLDATFGAISGDFRVTLGTPRVHAHVVGHMRAVRACIIRAMCVRCNGYSPKASLPCLPSYCLFLPPRVRASPRFSALLHAKILGARAVYRCSARLHRFLSSEGKSSKKMEKMDRRRINEIIGGA